VSIDLLLSGLESEKKVYQYLDLLTTEFSTFRKNNHSELQHWFSKELWKTPEPSAPEFPPLDLSKSDTFYFKSFCADWRESDFCY